MTWEIVLGIIALVGFAITIVSPILKLNTNIVKLNGTIESLKDSVDRIDKLNTEEHKKLWEHNDAQDVKISDIGNKVDNLRGEFDIAKALHPDLVKKV